MKLTQKELIDLLLIANYLDIQPLLNSYALFIAVNIPESLYNVSFGFEKKYLPQKENFKKYFTELLKGSGLSIPDDLIQYMMGRELYSDTKQEIANTERRTLQLFDLLGDKIHYENIAKMKHLINDGINLNMRENTDTPLMKALIFNQYDIAMELIKAGADVNLRNDMGQTALMKLAAAPDGKKGQCLHLKILYALIDAKADLNGKDRENKTALSIAILHSHKPLINALKKLGAR